MSRNVQPIAVALVAVIAVPAIANARPHPAKPVHTVPVVQGDITAGSDLFKARCAACHGRQGEGTALGPPLLGVVGSRAASSAFPGYTVALKASGVVWSPTKLDGFLAGPGKLIPGTAMVASLPKAEDRQDLVAYLMSLKK